MAPEHSAPSPALRRFCNLLFVLLLAGFVAMILRLPVFPSQDGPIHLYNAHIFGSLFRGGSPYEEHFRITQYFPPYSFFTYAFLALNTLADALLAEKLLVCGYVIWFCWSFRYLVHSVQPSNFVVPLLAFPLVMHRIAFMGFYNFIYAAATALFVAGFWIRHHANLTARRSACFAAFIAALTLTHPFGPIPPLGFVCLHIATGLVMSVFASSEPSWTARLGSAFRQHRRQLAHLAVFPFALGRIAMFSFPAELVEHGRGGSSETVGRLLALLGGWAISPFQALGYRALLLAVLALILLLVYRTLSDLAAQWRNALPLLMMGVGCIVAYFVVPSYGFFGDRLTVLALPFLAAFASARTLVGKAAATVAVVVVALSSALLWEQARMTESVAREIEPLLSAPVTDGSRVVIATDSRYESTRVLMYSPYLWAGAHYARRAQGTVVNAPWLIPNAPITTFIWRRPTPWGRKEPHQMPEYLRKHPSQLPPATALVIWKTGFANTAESELPTILGTQRTVFVGDNLALYVK